MKNLATDQRKTRPQDGPHRSQSVGMEGRGPLENMAEKRDAALENMAERRDAALENMAGKRDAALETMGDAKDAAAEAIAKVKPRLRGVSHEYAFFVSLVLGAVLIVLAEGADARASVAIYAVSVSAVFGVSALYH